MLTDISKAIIDYFDLEDDEDAIEELHDLESMSDVYDLYEEKGWTSDEDMVSTFVWLMVALTKLGFE